MNEERMRILNMVQSNQLSASEAATLLGALESASVDKTSAPESNPKRSNWRWFRILVTDRESGRQKVNIRMPFSLLQFGLKMGGVAGYDVESLQEALIGTGDGTLVDVDDLEDGERVLISVE